MENKIIDPWTVIHALVGFCLNPLPRKYAYPLIIIYEVVENKYLVGPIFQDEEGNLNIISDLIAGIGFYELGKKYGDRKV